MSGTRWTQLTLVTASTIRATEAPLGTRIFILTCTGRLRRGRRDRRQPLRRPSAPQNCHLELGISLSRRRGRCGRRQQSPRRLFAPQNQHLELGFLFSAACTRSRRRGRRGRRQSPRRLFAPQQRHLENRVFIFDSVHWTSATRQTRQTPTSASTVGATVAGLGTRVFILACTRSRRRGRRGRRQPLRRPSAPQNCHLELGISLSHALDLGDAADAADANNLRVDYSRHRTST
ncbi:hypothetical protein BKA62DRAFT_834636 [Auriculariales sp. MPI-PUGE-AT-0066]|nr:hypothetical protein BKA62DRAFT_834636 [Auriculariales sp. MPI-PUGE-AT-0066]